MKQRLLVWYGVQKNAQALRHRGLLLLALGLAWLLLFCLLPAAALAGVMFLQPSVAHILSWQPTLEHLGQALGFTPEGWDPLYLIILVRTAGVALLTTTVCVLLAYPVAFFLASRKPAARTLWLSLMILPLCTNVVIRGYAWVLLLHQDSWPVRALAALGFLPDGEGLYPGRFAVLLGLVSNALPFAVLPLTNAVERLDWTLVDAALDLKAGPFRVFWHALLPQTAAALSVAVLFTFVPTLGTYVLSDLLGGGKYLLVGNVIAQQFGPSNNWPFGAALSTLLVLFILLSLAANRRRGKGLVTL